MPGGEAHTGRRAPRTTSSLHTAEGELYKGSWGEQSKGRTPIQLPLTRKTFLMAVTAGATHNKLPRVREGSEKVVVGLVSSTQVTLIAFWRVGHNTGSGSEEVPGRVLLTTA